MNKKNNYRKCAGILLLNGQNLIFTAKRIDKPCGWQMPQGGIDNGEKPQNAALRELEEEIGIKADKITVIHTLEGLKYDFPDTLQPKIWDGKYMGQQQTWFFAKFLGDDKDINLNYSPNPEFKEWKWTNTKDVVHEAVNFKQEVYQTLVNELNKLEIKIDN